MIEILDLRLKLRRRFWFNTIHDDRHETTTIVWTPVISFILVNRLGKTLKRKRDRFVRTTRRIAMMLNPFPIYYIVDATDCDHYRVRSAGRASCGWQYLKTRDDEFAQAEGPTSMYRVSRKVAEDFRRSERDYGAEAYERGSPYSIRYD